MDLFREIFDSLQLSNDEGLIDARFISGCARQ
jgi:hypothetical protein